MFPKLFEIPLLKNGAVQLTWPIFIGLILGFFALVTYVLGPYSARISEKSRLKGQLVVAGPVALFVAAFILFLRTPFGQMPINSYGFAIMTGFLLASWVAVRRGKPIGFNSDFILDVGIISMIFGILGAKVNYLLQYPKDLADTKPGLFSDMGLNPLGALLLGPIPYAFWWWRTARPASEGQPARPLVKLWSWQNAVLLLMTLVLSLVGTRALYLYQHSDEYSWKLFRNWQSGFVLYGGLIAGVAAGVLYTKMRGESVARLADLAAAPIMLALAFGRLGCFLNGCCYGKVGTGFPCIRFPAESPAAHDQKRAMGEAALPVHPTQLYETTAAIAFFFLLSWFWRKPRKANGEVFLFMVMLYGGWRFLVEFIRGDDRPSWVGGLSYSQVVSLVAFAGAAVWLFLLRSRPPAAPEPSAPPAPMPPPPQPAR